MSIIKANKWQDVSGNLRTTALQTKATYSDTKATYSSSLTNTFAEVSTDYRVSITPSFSNSMIVVTYFIPFNIQWTGGSNCLKVFRAFRDIGGTKNYSVSSQGGALSSRLQVAGLGYRAQGYDYNDQNFATFTVIDFPNTTSTCNYGFEYRQENSNPSNDVFGYSAHDNNSWGYSSRIVITAQEISQ